MSIEEIRALCQNATLIVTDHFFRKCDERNILFSEIKQAIFTGKIIEEYLNSYPHPSCLICGKTESDRTIHIVVGIAGNKLYFITAYEPDSEHWHDDFTHRKE